MNINQSSGQGAVFELVARGIKDTFFVKDDPQSIFPYDGRYESSNIHLAERKTTVPLNQTAFGNTFEVELDPYGDILTECALEVNLPTWIPPMPLTPGAQPVSAERVNSLNWITDMEGHSYGYCNYIGYLMFERIQFYQDQVLIQEWSGDGLLASMLTEGSWNSSYLAQTVAGFTDPDSPRAVALRATPGHLRIKLPLPGMQTTGDGGFPLIGVQRQNYRFRIKLRALEDLIVTTRPDTLKPAPWKIAQFKYYPEGYGIGAPITFSPISRIDIGQPTILLSTIQNYVAPTIQAALKKEHIQIPFRRMFENVFTFGEFDYKPLDNGGTAAVTRRLDGRHPTERLLFFFRTQNALDQNRLDDFVNPLGLDGEFYNQIKLVIAGRDREHLWESYVWDKVTPHSKDDRYTGLKIGAMKWSLGEQYGTVYPAKRQPEGTVNFTTADRPTFYIELQNVPVNQVLNQRAAQMKVFTEAWAIYEIRDGRGTLKFAN
jgi:hypothetical protein